MDENHLYEDEISPKEVLKLMKTNIYDNFFKNSYFFISTDYIISRPSLFSLIRKISNKMGFKSQTYFLSIYYLDILFLKNKKIDCNFKTLGLACLLLSAKYVENDPCVPNLATFIRVYNNVVGFKYIISVTDLFYAEVLTCKMLGYKLNYYTIYDFDSFFFGHGIIKIEQLRELNNDNYLSSRNFEINDKNSIYIKKILEKIYRKSRHYLELIVNNSNICLKYNSLLISIFIMKKSVEEILLDEQRINLHDLLSKEKFLNKTSKYFKEIMHELYQINYESTEEYINLITDKDLIKLFQEEKNGDLSPVLLDLENNIKFANDNNDDNYINKKSKEINYTGSSNSISSYSYINRVNQNKFNNSLNKNNQTLNTSLNGSNILKKINLTRNFNRYNSNFKNEYSQSSYRISSKLIIKNRNPSISNRHNNLITNYLDISNLSSSKELNKIEPKNNNYEQKTNRALSRHIDINNLRYLQRFITYSNQNKINESNSISKRNNKSISVENDDDIIDLINSMENNEIYRNHSLKVESPIKLEKHNGYNYDIYKRMNGLKRKEYKEFNSYMKTKEYSSLIDNSNIINVVNTEKNIENDNVSNYRKSEKSEIKPYFKKVIKNLTNNGTINNFNSKKSLKQGLSQKTSTVSYFSLVNNNRNNVGKRKGLNSMINDKKNIYDTIDKSILYRTIEKNENDENKNRNKMNTEKKIFQKINNNNVLNVKKNIFNKNENNDKSSKEDNKIYEENKKEIINEENDDEINDSKNKENKSIPEIYNYSTSNSFINKRKERERLLLDRMKNIKNKKSINNINININNHDTNENENKINKTEVQNNNTDEKSESKYNNNRLNYKRRITKRESKNNLKQTINTEKIEPKSSFISKRKYFLSNKKSNEEKEENEINEKQINNDKDKKENNQIINTTTNSKNNNINNLNKETKYKSIRHKYINKIQNKSINYENKEEEKKDISNNNNINEEKKEKEEKKNVNMNLNINQHFKNKKEEKNKFNKKDLKIITDENKLSKSNTKSFYPTSSIFKLLNRTKKINDNKFELTKEELNLELPNNYLYNYNKRNKIMKSIRTIDHSESKDSDKKDLNIINKEVLFPKEISYNPINTDINNKSNIMNNKDRIIHSYHHRLLHKNKIRNNIDNITNSKSNNNSINCRNKNINTDSNKTANTIVINNNININFNNKIEPIPTIGETYIRNNVLKKTITENNNNNEYYDKIIINKTNNNNKRKTIIEKYNINKNRDKIGVKNYYTGGTIECINTNKNENKNDSISSLLHKIPFYKKTLENNKKLLSKDSSFEVK